MFRLSSFAVLAMICAIFAPNFLSSNVAGQSGGDPCDVDKSQPQCPASPTTTSPCTGNDNNIAGAGAFNAMINTLGANTPKDCNKYTADDGTTCGARPGIRTTNVCETLPTPDPI